jgi:hypothetical protein
VREKRADLFVPCHLDGTPASGIGEASIGIVLEQPLHPGLIAPARGRVQRGLTVRRAAMDVTTALEDAVAHCPVDPPPG